MKIQVVVLRVVTFTASFHDGTVQKTTT